MADGADSLAVRYADERKLTKILFPENGKQTFELSEEMCLGYENYIAAHTPLQGKENYAIFSAHDELLGDEASRIAQKVVSDAGYCVSIDSKGVHRITSSTIKIIGNLVNKE